MTYDLFGRSQDEVSQTALLARRAVLEAELDTVRSYLSAIDDETAEVPAALPHLGSLLANYEDMIVSEISMIDYELHGHEFADGLDNTISDRAD